MRSSTTFGELSLKTEVKSKTYYCISSLTGIASRFLTDAILDDKDKEIEPGGRRLCWERFIRFIQSDI